MRALDPWRVLDHFTKMGAECIIGRESHHDGGTHLHVFFQFEEKRRLSGVHIFDVDGYHPNVVPGYSNPRKGWEYATKDGDIVCGGLGCPSDGSDIEGKTDSKWAVIVASPDADTFGRMLKAWIRERYASALPAYRPTPATVIGLIEIHTSTQESYWSIVGSILSFKNGWTMSLGSAQKIGECAARGCRTHSLLVVWAELLSRALGSPPPLPPLRSGRQPARGPHPTVAWANILLEGSLSAYSDRQGLAKPCGQGVLANTPTSEDYSAWMSPLTTSTMPYSTICREDSNFSMDTNFGWAVNLNSTQQTNIRESDSYNGEGSQSG